MSHVLLINPNTRAALTAELVTQVGGPGMTVMGATAPFGADYIASESTYVVAAHAVLDAWQAHVSTHGRPRAVLVACFGDPGVWALRETAGVPVMGLAEAAMREADALGPFAIVTGGAAWGPMLTRLARGLQLGGPGRLRWVQAVAASGGALVADPAQGQQDMVQACAQVWADERAYQADLADLADHAGLAAQAVQAPSLPARATQPLASIILGGAALGGWAAQLAHRVPTSVPLIDSVQAGARWLRSVAS